MARCSSLFSLSVTYSVCVCVYSSRIYALVFSNKVARGKKLSGVLIAWSDRSTVKWTLPHHDQNTDDALYQYTCESSVETTTKGRDALG
jgi:hypothetical protein